MSGTNLRGKMNKILFISLLLVSTQTLAKLRLATYNIRNFDYDVRSNTPTNKGHLVNIISEMNPDLMAVQEINEKREFESMIDTFFHGTFETVLSECGGAHGQKLGFVYNTSKFKLITFKENFATVNVNRPNQNNRKNCHQGSRPLAIAQFKKIDTNEKIIAISVHLKSGGRPSNIQKRFKQIEQINKVVREFQEFGFKNIVIMGDFNSTEYINKGYHYDRFKNEVSSMNLTDSTSKLKCTSYWWGGTRDQMQYPSTLDHILVSTKLIGKKKFKTFQYGHCKKLNCEISDERTMGVSFDEVSDHCPIVTEIE